MSEDWEDLCGDGTILKQIVQEAPAENVGHPKAGDKVQVHYVGTLSETGKEFDSSRSRGSPFEFKVGTGVITGWSEAVPTMRQGEISKFRIASSKAYGDEGSPPSIPAKASLDFEIELLSFTDREDVNVGGPPVLKKVIARDDSKWRKPNHTCDLFFEYRGQEVTWTSRAKEPPAGLTALCRTALEAMVDGEVANFLIESKEYEFKLLRWVENEECVPSKAGAVVKRVERQAKDDEYKTPNDTSLVTVTGTVSTAQGVEVTKYDAARWTIDEPSSEVSVCEGVEAAVKRMKVGEMCTVAIDKAYGFKDKVPAEFVGVDLTARLELVELEEEPPSWDLKGDDKIQAVDEKRNMGNTHFGRGDYARAGRRYTQAINIGSSDYDLDDDRKKRLKTATDAARLNRAACHLKTKEYAEARNDANAVLDHEPDNAKALFRRAKALIGLDEWERARIDLKKLLDQTPDSVDAKRALADCAKREKAYKQHQKQLYAGRDLFKSAKTSKSAPTTTAAAPDEPPPPPPASEEPAADDL